MALVAVHFFDSTKSGDTEHTQPLPLQSEELKRNRLRHPQRNLPYLRRLRGLCTEDVAGSLAAAIVPHTADT